MSTSDVKNYYDANTAWFLRFGQSGKTQTIHRAVWGPGVHRREQSFFFVEDRIHEQLQCVPSIDGVKRVVDLGCGVGASLAYLARRSPIRGTGVTLSPVQVELARQRFHREHLSDRLQCVEGSYLELPLDDESTSLGYAIESFVLGPDPQAFFVEAARVLTPGGKLIVCDDFSSQRASDEATLSPRERTWLDEFRRGWIAHSLLPVARVRELAHLAGLRVLEDTDLTPYLELRRPRDRAITLLVNAGRRLALQHPWWLNLLGGNALQMGLVGGLIEYRLLAFEKTTSL